MISKSKPIAAEEETDASQSGWLTTLGVFVAIGMLIVGGLALIESRNDAWQQARQSAGNLLLALDRDINRNLSLLDLSLLGLTEALAEPGIWDVSPGIRQHALFDRSASAEDLGAILVLDANGKITADSTSHVPHSLVLADRDYFQVHRDSPDGQLYVSRAFESRLSNGDPRFAVSRRIDTADGKFAGVVLATLRLSYFQRLFEKLDLGGKGAITVLRTDGRVLFRYPFRREDIDADVSKASSFGRFAHTKAGQYVAASMLDGVERLYTYRHIGDLPLILTVNLSTDEIFLAWRRKAYVIGPALLVLCACAIRSVLLFRREMKRRTRSERALAEAARQLSIQATTDGLTSIMNRRAFDADFALAFRAATRQGKPIAVLMIDVDFFKRFNDSFGHGAGDDALRAMADCLRSFLKRPGDRIARYGGEEFVAILPDADVGAAGEIAERMRAGIRALHIPHPTSPIGSLSVSIGAASAMPLIGDQAEHLLQCADKNLYAAKETGRDRVVCTTETYARSTSLATLVAVATAHLSADEATNTAARTV